MFKLIKKEEIKSLELELFEFEHVETKARHIHLKADDSENAFICGFKTLPDSKNGVKHILEHSVLQGSRDFPLKDTFTAIYKKSLQTYMNATTDTDHTYYLFASQNKKDFFNLMHVYTNSTFFPSLRKETFLQEGWRYEFAEPTNANSDLTVTGVVFNEMKGILSSPTSQLWGEMFRSLYPDTKYAHDSGGIPKNIPELSYEEFCDYHKKYYHPSNAVFLTYGDIAYTEIQEKLETQVLNEFNFQDMTIENPIQEPFKEIKNITVEYPYTEDDAEEQHYYLKLYNITDITKTEESFTVEFLNSLISASAESVMTKALEDSKLFTSSMCFSADNGRDVFLIIGGSGLKLENKDKIDSLVAKTLDKVVTEGFSDKRIASELHSFELAQKTKTAGRSTYGLNMLTTVLASTIHNVEPSTFLKADTALELLKERMKDKNYLQNFLKEKIVNNPHQVNLTFKASNEKAKLADKDFNDSIKQLEKGLSDEDKQAIIKNFEALEAYQAEVDPENILPEISVADIPLEKELQELETKEFKNTKVYAFKAPTSGLTYMTKTAFIDGFDSSDISFLNLYSRLINMLGYADKTYGQASELITEICDNISFSTAITEDRHNPDKIYIRTSVGSKMLNKNRSAVKTLMDEVVNNRRFDEKDRIVSKIKELNHYQQMNMVQINNAISIASELAKSTMSKIDRLSLAHNGIEYSMFLKNLAENIDDEAVYDNLISKLKLVDEKVKQAYARSALAIVDLEEELDKSIEIFFDENTVFELKRFPIVFNLKPFKANAFITDKSNTNYCVMSTSAPYLDHELAGAYSVLGRIISNEYLHSEIREKGGAYGGSASYSAHSETFTMASWYDPNLTATFNVYKNVEKWLLDESNITGKQIEEGILQAVGSFDSPSLKIAKCSGALSHYFDEVTNSELLEFREKLLKTDIQQIRRVINELLIPGLKNATCGVVANKTKFNNEKLDMIALEF